MGILRNSRNWLIKGPIWAYIYFFAAPRCWCSSSSSTTAAQWEWLKNSAAWTLFSEAWFCALLAFTLNTGAYTAEIVRGAVMNMPKGQIEAATPSA
jgi:arginine/ornithine transport system permease protein